jgi:hypothetical protein
VQQPNIALSQLLTIEKSRVRLAPEGHLQNFFLVFFRSGAFLFINEQAKPDFLKLSRIETRLFRQARLSKI